MISFHSENTTETLHYAGFKAFRRKLSFFFLSLRSRSELTRFSLTLSLSVLKYEPDNKIAHEFLQVLALALDEEKGGESDAGSGSEEDEDDSGNSNLNPSGAIGKVRIRE